MVRNPDKCSSMLLGVDDELQTNLVCGNETLKNSKQEKILGVSIDNKLKIWNASIMYYNYQILQI